jgi:hypothetical protein
MAKKPLLLEKGMVGSPATSQPQAQSQAPAPASTPVRRALKDYGEPLNFRVPPEFGQQFRMVALRRKLKLHQLLQKCFEVYLREEGEGLH